jgi:hypothetical protein
MRPIRVRNAPPANAEPISGDETISSHSASTTRRGIPPQDRHPASADSAIDRWSSIPAGSHHASSRYPPGRARPSCYIDHSAEPAARISDRQLAWLELAEPYKASPACHSANRIGAGRSKISPASRRPSTRCSAQTLAKHNSMFRGNRPAPAMMSRRMAAISASDNS